MFNKNVILITVAVNALLHSFAFAEETGWKIGFQKKNEVCYSQKLEFHGERSFKDKLYLEYEADNSKFTKIYRQFKGYFTKTKIAPFDDVTKIEFIKPDIYEKNGILIYKYYFKDGSVSESDDNFIPLYLCKNGSFDIENDIDKDQCFNSYYLNATCVDPNKTQAQNVFINMNPMGNGKRPNARTEKLLFAERISANDIQAIYNQHAENLPKLEAKRIQVEQLNREAKLADEAEKAKRYRAELDFAINVLEKSPSGTVMFCESPREALLQLGEPISSAIFYCDLMKGQGANIRSLMSNNWQILNQTKTAVEAFGGSTGYQYSLQVKKK